MWRIILSMLALAVLTAPTAFAQDTDRPVYIGPQVGLYTNDIDDDDITAGIGAAVRFKVADVLGLEGAINYRQEEFGDDELTVKTWPVLATAMFYPVETIYGLLGLGVYNTSTDRNEDNVDLADDTDSEIGWHFGGGLELPLGERALLTGDLRYVLLDQGIEDPSGLITDDQNFYLVTIGIMVGL